MKQKPMLKLQTPDGEKRVLLHSCCAPCSSAIIECLLANDIRPTLFYYNPNIYPQEEYEIRKDEAIRYTRSLGLDFVDGDYDYRQWRRSMQGLENEPERPSTLPPSFGNRTGGKEDCRTDGTNFLKNTDFTTSSIADVSSVCAGSASTIDQRRKVIFCKHLIGHFQQRLRSELFDTLADLSDIFVLIVVQEHLRHVERIVLVVV